MQIPPLDLQQFGIIKGSSSTLYGGGAIAGLVNMVSRTPDYEPSLDVMLTQTHALSSTANARNVWVLDTPVALHRRGEFQIAATPCGVQLPTVFGVGAASHSVVFPYSPWCVSCRRTPSHLEEYKWFRSRIEQSSPI